MANTVFTDFTTVIVASWLNDVNNTVYQALGDGSFNAPTTAAQVIANLGLITSANIASTYLTQANAASTYAALAGSSSQVFSVGTPTAAAHAVRLDQMPQFPFRNRIVNGDMSISQVNGGTAITPAGSSFISDQWQTYLPVGSKLTFQQVADAPAGLKYSTKVTVAAQYSPTAAQGFQLVQNIEGQNIIDFQMGLAGAATIVTSHWIKGSVAGTYSVAIWNGAANRSYIGTVSVTNAWQRLSVVLVGDVTGTWATDATTGFTLVFDLGSGSNYNTTSGAWQAGIFTRTAGSVTFVNQVNGSTLNITGVQVEAVPTGATVPTSYEVLPYEAQLRRCQRYLPVWNSTGTSSNLFSGAAYATNTNIPFILPVPTRVPVTNVVVNNATYLSVTSMYGNYAGTAVGITGYVSVNNVSINLQIATLGNAATPVVAYFNNAAGQLYFTGAQL